MRILADLAGTFLSYFRIGKTGPRLKNNSGALNVRDAGDSADAALTAAAGTFSGTLTGTVLHLTNTAGTIVLNSGAAGSGADWTYTFQRPTSGMTAAVTLTLPVDDGTSGQVLSTDGSGVLSWISAANTAICETVDTTTLAYNSTSTVSMFTLPANAVINLVRVTVDTAFDGSGPTPSMSVGVSGTASKYMGSGDVDLTTVGVYEVAPGLAADASTEALQIAFTAGGSASAGAARVEVFYDVPQ